MAMAADRHPGDAEAVAAINGLAEVYGGPLLPDEGQWVTGVTCGKRFSGCVQSAEPGRVVVEIDGAWLVVRPSEIDAW
ncbi:MAG: hypothetical protein ACR2IT_00860 [Pirellulales bacterium]